MYLSLGKRNRNYIATDDDDDDDDDDIYRHETIYASTVHLQSKGFQGTTSIFLTD